MDSLIKWMKSFHYPRLKTPEYTELRQETTDEFGTITFVCTVVVMCIIPGIKFLEARGYTIGNKIHVFRMVNVKFSRWIHDEDLDGGNRGPVRFHRVKRAIGSGISETVLYLYYHSRSLLLLSFWTILLSALSLLQTNDGDLIYVAKRLGKVAAVCLPTVFFLSLRPTPLPHTLYLALLPVHKWLSRVVIVQSIVHTVIYLGFFNFKKTWFKALKTENLYGWVSLLGFLVILITSVLKFKDRYYRFFYFQHYSWSWIIVACLQLHARPTKITIYTALNVAILLSQIVYRIRLTRVSATNEVKVHDIASHMQLVEIPNDLITKRGMNPGAHVRITEYKSCWIPRWFKQIIPNYHPYTLASLPLDKYQKLIVRRGAFSFKNNRRYLICGSYDPKLLFLSSKNTTTERFTISKLRVGAKRVLIIVGGSAISFALPILRVTNYHGIPTKIVWVIKDFREITVLKHFDGFIHGDDFEIFVTGCSEVDQERLSRKYDSKGKSNWRSPTGGLSDNEDEQLPLLSYDDAIYFSDNENVDENENIEIVMDNDQTEEESEDEECVADNTLRSNFDTSFEVEGENHSSGEDASDEDGRHSDFLTVSPTKPKFESKAGRSRANSSASQPQHAHHAKSSISRKSSTSQKTGLSRKASTSTTNEAFHPTFENTGSLLSKQIQIFNTIVKSLNIEHKIYKGRPKINYKYYNWCLNEGFTQCTGPVDVGSGVICCRDVFRPTTGKADPNDIWVISAGPRSLVSKVKVWSNEAGFNFHEECFYV